MLLWNVLAGVQTLSWFGQWFSHETVKANLQGTTFKEAVSRSCLCVTVIVVVIDDDNDGDMMML